MSLFQKALATFRNATRGRFAREPVEDTRALPVALGSTTERSPVEPRQNDICSASEARTDLKSPADGPPEALATVPGEVEPEAKAVDPSLLPAGVPAAPPKPAVAEAIKPDDGIARRKPASLRLAKRPAPWPPETLSLALQGGGSFGAFTWGVLDRLLEEPQIDFDAVSGSSAGAVNAVLLASGMIDGGREGARERLNRFWKRASQAAALVPVASPLGAGLELIMRMMSPYQFNPFNVNPLREALTAEVDFERLRERSKIKLLLGATRVRDGSLRILTNKELTVDAVLASACLPLLHHAIELDGEPYWDGGYAANPPLIPLVRASESSHIMIVQVTPNMSDRLPRTTGEIATRIEQIQFNATLNSELEALKYGKILGAADKLRQLRIGRISADDHLEGFGAESAANLRWDFLERLRLGGRAAAEAWLNQDIPALRRPA